MSRHVWRRLSDGARSAARAGFLLDPGRRNHLAMLSAALAVTIFGYIVLQPRRVVVQADGRQVVLSTHMAQDGAVLRRSGVDVGPGDRVTALTGRDGEILRVERASAVSLHVDGAVYQVLTHAETIDQLLAEANVALGDRDSVVQNGELVSPAAPVEPPKLFAPRGPLSPSPGASRVEIDVRRAVPISITENGRTVDSSSSRQTVIQALREAGVVVGPGDVVRPEPLSVLTGGTHIEVQHARAVTVTLPDDHRVLYTLSSTVGAALSEAGIVIPQGAFTLPSLDAEVTSGMTVRVVQLSAASDQEREYIESDTVYKPDPALAPGETRTVQGHDGVHVRRYEVSYVDGQEAGRTLVDDYYDPEPVDTVIYYPVQKAKNDAPPAAVAGKTLHVYATWYNPASSGRAASDPAYGHTATGVLVTYGIVAVDPDVIPLGTKMYIPGYGYAVAADTGGAVKGYIIDLGFPDGVQVDWQSKWVDITILS